MEKIANHGFANCGDCGCPVEVFDQCGGYEDGDYAIGLCLYCGQKLETTRVDWNRRQRKLKLDRIEYGLFVIAGACGEPLGPAHRANAITAVELADEVAREMAQNG